jgi:N-acetyl-gamma-glutamyl-phosphate reductase
MQKRVGVFGASGYAGVELTAILAEHPHAQLAFLASERWVGTTADEAIGLRGSPGKLRYVAFAEAMHRARECDAVLLATPTEASLDLAPRLVSDSCRVIDLSGAFRLRDATQFKRAYGLEAPSADLLARSVWGLPELSRKEIAAAPIIANPGCYPTAAALALGPLLARGLVEPDDLIVDALSGVSGAGRRATEDYSFVELAGDARAYKVLSHQHTPEIAQGLAAFAGQPVSVVFTPHLVPVARGILSTAYARLRAPATSAELTDVFRAAYKDERFVQIATSPEAVSLRRVVGTNECLIGVAAKPDASGRVVVVSAIDNLVKGAAGQAVQNLNLALRWEEMTGLRHLRRQLT